MGVLVVDVGQTAVAIGGEMELIAFKVDLFRGRFGRIVRVVGRRCRRTVRCGRGGGVGLLVVVFGSAGEDSRNQHQNGERKREQTELFAHGWGASCKMICDFKNHACSFYYISRKKSTSIKLKTMRFYHVECARFERIHKETC